MTDSKTSEHHAKALAVAEKIAKHVDDTLAPLARMMIIMKWPAEFQAIMWSAVAAAANRLAVDAHE